jgi:anaerobic selenocysteine-containing dehydrogenase
LPEFLEATGEGDRAFARFYPTIAVDGCAQRCAERGIRPGDWVNIETPEGSVRARARFNDALAPGVVCGQHGWWQACPDIGAPGYDPFGPEGSNFNLIIGNAAIDPISGSVPHRAYLCQVRRVD